MNELKKYLALWQKKRMELPVDADPQADWQVMKSLLDAQMPLPKKGKGFKGFGTLPAVLITLSAAAMIYTAASVYRLEKHKKHITQEKRGVVDSRNVNNISMNSLKAPDSATTGKHSPGIGKTAGNPGGVAPDKNHSLTEVSPGIRTGNTNSNVNSADASQRVNLAGRHIPLHSSATQASGQNFGNRSSGGRRGQTPAENRLVQNPSGKNNTNPKLGQYQSANNVTGNAVTDGSHASTNFYRPDSSETGMFWRPYNKISDMSAMDIKKTLSNAVVPFKMAYPTSQSGTSKTPNRQNKTTANTKPSNFDWGLLFGGNTSGGVTANLFPGLFASYKFNGNWALSTQLQLFSPQHISTTYSHANQSKVDSGQILSIVASRKLYSINIPIYAEYNTGNGLSFKAGPLIGFAVKQSNTNSILSPYSVRTDSTYNQKITAILNATKYGQTINFGISAGAGYQFNRFVFGIDYIKSLSGFQVSSGLGTFKSYNGTFQITVGFQLDKVK